MARLNVLEESDGTLDPDPTAVTPLFNVVVREVLGELLCLHNHTTQRTLHPMYFL